jgi:F420-non-reducing hydrogenase small subunit
MTATEKPRLAIYWGASCGGCEIATLNIGDKILEVDAAFDIVFWPCATDFKYEDVRGYPDDYIDLCLFNGAIRNAENEEMAHLLRRKSKVLVAFGSCAHEGCIPALSNLTSAEETLRIAFLDNPTIDNPKGTLPQQVTQVPEGELHMPQFYNTVMALNQVTEVDYIVPGCPPEPPQIWAVLDAVIQGAALPPPGNTILGAGTLAVCAECPLERHEKQIERFYRPYEKTPEPGLCLLEQGIVCLGIATRSGCGALCPQVNMGCRGCYGLMDEVDDQGANMISSLAAVVAAGELGTDEDEIERKIEAAMDTLVDPAGTFYRFNMAHSLLQRVRTDLDGHGNGGAQ